MPDEPGLANKFRKLSAVTRGPTIDRPVASGQIRTLSREQAAALVQRADDLQREAADVVADLGLLPTLAAFGNVVRTGSSVYGLMVARDIDVYVVRDRWSAPLCWGALADVFSQEAMQSIRLSKWVEPHAVDDLPEGYSAVLRHRASGRELWRVDVWFFTPATARSRLRLHEELTRPLPDEMRIAILWIKEFQHDRPDYVSADIYEAVLHHGVRTPEQWQRHLTTNRRSAPA